LRAADHAPPPQDLLVRVIEGAPAPRGDPVHRGDLPSEDGPRTALVATLEAVPGFDERLRLAAARHGALRAAAQLFQEVVAAGAAEDSQKISSLRHRFC